MIKKTLNFILYYLLLLLGLIGVSWMIWSRFFRERLPKDIPFQLTEYRFWLLLYISCIYLYRVKSLIKPKNTNIVIKELKEIIEIIYKPLTILDHYIKYNKYIKPYYYTFMIKTTEYLDITKSKYYKLQFTIFLMEIFPRIILIIFLLFDTFYFQRIEMFYKIILIGLLPFILRYIKYSLKDIYEQWILDLENNYSGVHIYEEGYKTDKDRKKTTEAIYHFEQKTIREYIEIKYENIFEYYGEKVTYEYNSYAFCNEDIFRKYNFEKYKTNTFRVNGEDLDILEKLYKELMPSIINLKLILFRLHIINESEIIKWSKIVIFSLYFICWSYILVVSYYNYPNDFEGFMYIIKTFIRYLSRINDPFADINNHSLDKNLITKKTIKYIIKCLIIYLKYLKKLILQKFI